MPYAYAFSILLSAFLLFQIQPMMGESILPWFGGTPTVWSTVLLFFQSLLTGGYAYAYWLLAPRRGRQQGAVHLLLLGISLERELASGGPQGFDLLVLDTFNGDAMPMHLLTREAFAIYLQHLSPGGILAVNVSNRYFNLSLEVYRLADALNLDAALIEDHGDGIQSYDSIWMLLSQPGVLERPAFAGRSTPRPAIPAQIGVWADDRSNLLQILK